MARGGGSGGPSSAHGGGSARMHSSGGYSRGGASGGGSVRHTGYRSPGAVPPPPGRYRRYGGRYVGRPVFRVGCLPAAVTLILFLVIFLAASVRSCASDNRVSSEISPSTLERSPISGTREISEWYEEHTSKRWIVSESELKNGLEHFYRETGVQPYIVITESIDGVSGMPSESQFVDYLREIYDEKMPDGGHLVIGVYDDSAIRNDYSRGFACYAGAEAEAVMDNEAQDILIDYLELYYSQDGLSDEAFLSRAVAETADKIMTVDRVKRAGTAKIVVAVSAVVLAVVLVVFILRWKRLKVRQAEADARILESDPAEPEDPLKAKYRVDEDDVPR